MESKRRQPSVIARLMGLDVLPPQLPAHKQHNFFSENYLHRKASVGFKEKSSFYEGHSFRKSVEQQQEFKDVFEVLETSKVKQSDLSVLERTANSKLTEARMEIIMQKLMDAKRLSMDETLQYSKGFHDALEVLNSNKDIFLKFLQEPDSLFSKHLHDLQDLPPHPQSGHITVLKSSNAPEFENIDIRRGSERKTGPSDVINSLQKHDNCLLTHSYCKHGVHNSHKLSKSRFKGKDETCLLPTRIVVLKPNLRKAQNAARSFSSPISSESFQSSYTKHKEYSNCGNGDLLAEVQVRKNSSNDVELLRHRSRGSREMAKEIIRQMRQRVSIGSIKVSRSESRGYTGDESSCNMSKNDSAIESDVVTLTSRNSFDWKNHYSPSSYSTESSVSNEAKKRLSERWKMTHRVQEAGLVGRGSTLREILVMPDRETRPKNLDSTIGHDGPGDRFSRKDGGARWGSFLGFSSRDRMKDGYARNIGSLPPSSTAFGSPKTSIRHVALRDERCMPQEAKNQGQEKFIKGDFDQKDGLFPKILRSSCKKSQSSFSTERDNEYIVQEIYLSLDELRDNLDVKNLSEKKPMVPKPSSGNATDTSFIADVVGDAEPVEVAMSSETPEEKLSESTEWVLIVKDGDFSGHETHDPDDSIPKESIGNPEESSSLLRCPVPEPESSASSKEADQPSPVSVPESPNVGEISSGSECFERVSADLHGLRMQLQLLKLESSEAYAEGLGIVVSSDEDIEEPSVGVPEEKGGELMGMFKAEENRDSSYLTDVLVESGFHCADLEMCMATCYSLECPVGLLVFEKLEKKYHEQTSWPRSERRLLFERINLGLMEILRLYVDPHLWVKPISKRVGLRWREETLEKELWKLLVRQGMEVRDESAEKVSGREVDWLEFGDEINLIGGEIERLLMDELVQEVMSL